MGFLLTRSGSRLNRSACTGAHACSRLAHAGALYTRWEKEGLEKPVPTCQVERRHPVSGRAVPEAEVAEDIHGPHEQVEESPVAGAVDDVTLLGHEPEGHHQPVGTWTEAGSQGPGGEAGRGRGQDAEAGAWSPSSLVQLRPPQRA